MHKNQICAVISLIMNTLKPVLSGYSKIDITKILETNGSLMKAESIAECSLGKPISVFLRVAVLHRSYSILSSYKDN